MLSGQAYHLRKFASFADKTASGQPLTTALALQWATSVGHNRCGYHAMRYQSVRGLARYLAAIDPHAEVPPARMLGSTCIRRRPHIYTPEQVRLMMKQSRQLPHRVPTLHSGTDVETMMKLVFCRSSPGRGVQVGPPTSTLGAHDSNHQTKFSPQRTCHYIRPSCVRGTLPKGATADHSVRNIIFVGRRGVPSRPKRLAFSPLAVVASSPNPRARVHGDLRHTFATRLISPEPPRRTGAAHLGAVAPHGHNNSTHGGMYRLTARR
jgi:hypothetical protein